MNKPNKCRTIAKINALYHKNLLEIFNDCNYLENSDLYNRNVFFKGVECNFIVNRSDIVNKIKLEEFVSVSNPLIETLTNLYGPGDFWNIQTAKMKGGGRILPHCDNGLSFLFSHRIHIPLITNENVIFKIADKEFYFPVGYAYEINNTQEHSVVNNNDPSYERLHLIFDYLTYEYMPFIS